MRHVGVEVEVYDATTGDYDTAATVFGPASHETASKYAADLNLREPKQVAAPSCGCARKDRVIEHYRVFAAQVSRSCRDTDTQEHALRTIKEASEMMRQSDV
jgi:hypothetical protein